jgi:hypothetical protein
MRCVTAQQYSPRPERARHLLVSPVRADCLNLVLQRPGPGHQALNLCGDIRLYLVRLQLRRDAHCDAPQTLFYAAGSHDDGPVLGIDHVVRRRVAMLSKVVVDVDRDESPVLPSEAFKWDVEGRSHDRVGSVAGDDEWGAERRRRRTAGCALHLYVHEFSIILMRDVPGVVLDGKVRGAQGVRPEDRRQLGLAQLNAIINGPVGRLPRRDFGQDLVGAAERCPKTEPLAVLEARGDHIIQNADLGKFVENDGKVPSAPMLALRSRECMRRAGSKLHKCLWAVVYI